MSCRTRKAYVHKATSMMAGTAVQRTSSLVLPWIGGAGGGCLPPVSPGGWRPDRRAVEVLLARTHPEVQDREEDHGRHQDEHGHRADDQHVPERVDLLGLLG